MTNCILIYAIVRVESESFLCYGEGNVHFILSVRVRPVGLEFYTGWFRGGISDVLSSATTSKPKFGAHSTT